MGTVFLGAPFVARNLREKWFSLRPKRKKRNAMRSAF